MFTAKKVKTLVVLVLLSTILANFVKVSAASYEEGYVGSVKVSGSSSIGATNASGYTSASVYSPGIDVYVSSHYIAKDNDTLEYRYDSKSSNGKSSTSVFFTFPNCTSVRIDSYHSATDGTDSWGNSTSATYP